MTLNPIGVSAKWRKDSNGWWYSKGSSWSQGWDLIDSKWYYFGQDGYMKTGWLKDGESWYYIYQNGDKAVDTVIDGFTLDLDGVRINKPTKEEEDARNLILKEDSNFIAKLGSDYMLLKRSKEGGSGELLDDKWEIPREGVFEFTLLDSESEAGYTYLVGKTSKNVYILPTQGFLPVYQIKDNNIVKTFEWIGDGSKNIDWRNR